MKTTSRIFWTAFFGLNIAITVFCYGSAQTVKKEIDLLDKQYIRSEINLHYIMDTSVRVGHYARDHKVFRKLCPECAELRKKGLL